MKTPSIFISYRRSDAEGWAGRLSDSLRAHLGHVRIFRDIEEIPPGVDFVEYFSKAVGECDAFIEIIGPGWLTATDAGGRRRLDDPTDSTRLEVASAIRRNIRVIPVLLEGATMPKAEDLPEDLRPLARRNAYPLSDSRWAEDTKKLAGILSTIVQSPRKNYRTIAMAAGVIVAVMIGTALYQILHQAHAVKPVVPHTPSTSQTRPVRGGNFPVAKAPIQKPAQPNIEIRNAVCTRIARGQFQVEMSGYASGPAEAYFFAASNPNNGIDQSMLTRCVAWSQSRPSDGPRNQKMCKRGPNEAGETNWQSTNIFRNEVAPPEGCATLYLMPVGAAQAKTLVHRCIPLVCR